MVKILRCSYVDLLQEKTMPHCSGLPESRQNDGSGDANVTQLSVAGPRCTVSSHCKLIVTHVQMLHERKTTAIRITGQLTNCEIQLPTYTLTCSNSCCSNFTLILSLLVLTVITLTDLICIYTTFQKLRPNLTSVLS